MYVLEHFVQQSWYVRVYVYVVEPLAQQSAPQQRNPLCTKQQTKYVPIRVRIKISMYVHAFCVPFVFLEHGALGICKSPVYT